MWRMASLEFAFLAEFAKVEANATLTAVAAGLRGVACAPNAERITLFLAGGVNRQHGEGSLDLVATTIAPGELYSLERTVEMEPVDGAPGDFAVTVFAIQLEIPIVGDGRYVVRVAAGGEHPRDIDLWLKRDSSDAVASGG